MTGPFNSLPPETQNMLALQCNSKACIDARNKAITARNAATAACSDVKRLESDRAAYTGIMAAILAALIALIVAAIAAPWPLNLILWIIATLVTIALVVMIVLLADNLGKLNAAKAALAVAMQDFQDAIADIQTHCNSFCPPIDQTLPTCL